MLFILLDHDTIPNIKLLLKVHYLCHTETFYNWQGKLSYIIILLHSGKFFLIMNSCHITTNLSISFKHIVDKYS